MGFVPDSREGFRGQNWIRVLVTVVVTGAGYWATVKLLAPRVSKLALASHTTVVQREAIEDLDWELAVREPRPDQSDASAESQVGSAGALIKLDSIRGRSWPPWSGLTSCSISPQSGGDREEWVRTKSIGIASRLGVAVAALASVLVLERDEVVKGYEFERGR